MISKELLRLLAGFRRFRERYFLQEGTVYQRVLSSGQAPKTLIIACSDSRVDPAIITSASPGELFVVRNVANLVPPYETTGRFHGVSSAIEFAVVNLKVENIVVMGHRQCGGVRALVEGKQKAEGSFVGKWMEIAKDARSRVMAKHQGADFETLCRECEMESILVSLQNLKTFPFVTDAIRERNLTLLGTYFDLEQGEMFEYDEANESFRKIDIPSGADTVEG